MKRHLKNGPQRRLRKRESLERAGRARSEVVFPGVLLEWTEPLPKPAKPKKDRNQKSKNEKRKRQNVAKGGSTDKEAPPTKQRRRRGTGAQGDNDKGAETSSSESSDATDASDAGNSSSSDSGPESLDEEEIRGMLAEGTNDGGDDDDDGGTTSKGRGGLFKKKDARMEVPKGMKEAHDAGELLRKAEQAARVEKQIE